MSRFDGTVNTETAGRIMSLLLDYADPAHHTPDPLNPLEQAVTLDPELAAAIAAGYFRAVVNGIAAQFGPTAAAGVIQQLAAAGLRTLDPAADDS